MKTTATQTEPATSIDNKRENRHFFYYCPNLDLWAVGRTREEAEANLKEEIRLLLTRCREYLDSAESADGGAYATEEVRPS